jgi:hypothetical protein
MLYDLVMLTASISISTWVVLMVIYHASIISFLKRIVGVNLTLVWLRLIWLQSFIVSLVFGVRPWGLDKYAISDVSIMLNNNKMVYEGVQAFMWSLLSTSLLLFVVTSFIIFTNTLMTRIRPSRKEDEYASDDYQIPLL